MDDIILIIMGTLGLSLSSFGFIYCTVSAAYHNNKKDEYYPGETYDKHYKITSRMTFAALIFGSVPAATLVALYWTIERIVGIVS